jgi:hypothetical protein
MAKCAFCIAGTQLFIANEPVCPEADDIRASHPKEVKPPTRDKPADPSNKPSAMTLLSTATLF